MALLAHCWAVTALALLFLPLVAIASKPNLYQSESTLFYWPHLGLNSGNLQTGSRAAAFADVNSDKKVDLIVLSSDQHTLSVHLWNSDQSQFNLEQSMPITTNEFKITGVAPGDFNFDGKIDLFVFGKVDGSTASYIGQVFFLDWAKKLFIPGAQKIISDEELLVFDYNADMHLDLFGFANGTKSVWINNGKGIFESAKFDAMNGRLSKAHPDGRPHSYVDLNGDCIADLAVATDSNILEMYIWDKASKNWQHSHDITLAPDSGPVIFADANADGTLDMLYASGKDKVVVHYNIQKPLCKSSSSSNCRSADDLCSADDYFRFNSYEDGKTVDNVVISQLTFSLDETNRLLRVGDVNADGLPELLATQNTGKIVMLSCQSSGGVAAVTDSRIQSPLDAIPNAIGAAFFDINEDGIQDVLLMDKSAEPVKFFINNLNEDSFFFKSLVSNGVCSEWCSDQWTERFPNPKPYGVNQPGVTIKFTVADTSGARRMVSGAQLSQSSYKSMQNPYVFAGLARTFSYIEQFSVGVSSGKVGTWTSMIPNSQLVVFPYPPDSPEDWVVELFLNPSSNWLWVAVSVVVTSVALLAAIVILHWRNLKADLLLQRKAERFFTF